MHDIREIIIIDHMDCGAFRLAYSEEELNKVGEYQKHVENLIRAKRTLNNKFPRLRIKLFILDANKRSVDQII